MSNVIILIILAVCSYFLGNVNWAIIITKLKKSDIRSVGSGNPGTLNMSRNFGFKLGVLTFFLDIMKGVIPALVGFFVMKGRVLGGTTFLASHLAMFLCGFSAVIGHIFPVIFKFKGGKGIASTIGVFLVCESCQGWQWSIVIIMALIAAALFIYFSEFGAMASFIAITPPAIASCIWLYLTYGKLIKTAILPYYIITTLLIFAICLFTWFAHRKNIGRMLAGEEHPTSIKEMFIKMKAKKLAKLNNEQNNTEIKQ